MSMPQRPSVTVDIAIIGGGIAGLWLLDVLRRQGYETVLLERSALGEGQTILSQGMIHGGVKYALGGWLTGAAAAIAAMPARWRRCLEGLRADAARGDVDLEGVRVLSDAYYMWSNETTKGRLGMLLASRALRGRIERVAPGRLPPPFTEAGFRGSLYALNDLVLDVPALLRHLAAPHRERIWRAEVTPQGIAVDGDGQLTCLQLDCARLQAKRYVFAAGAGNAALLEALPFATPAMQRRPLQQVILRDVAAGPLYAHYVHSFTRSEPRLTVTSHRQRDGGWSWYLGGALASEGAERSRDAQIAAARRELADALPWLELGASRIDTLRVDRAEPRHGHGLRPDNAFVERAGNTVICWPTKLSLVPDLADRVLARLALARPGASWVPAHDQPWPAVTTPPVATPPWEQ